MITPLISIIVPVYKVEAYLRKCVDSILAQTYTNIEVILVDDGSPDGCPAICDEYAAKDSRVVVIHQKNAGVSAARNAGLDAAKGEYIGFVDSDDWIEPDMYEVLYRMIIDNGVEVSIISYNNDTDEYEHEIVRSDSTEAFSQSIAIQELFNGEKYQGQMWSKLVSTKLFDGCSFPVGVTICEDLYLSLKVFTKVQKVAYKKYTCYHYITRNTSALHVFNDRYFSANEIYEKVFTLVNEYSPENCLLAKSKYISHNISVAILASDSDRLDNNVYKKIKAYIDSVNSLKVCRLLGGNIKLWLALFKLGRVPFIVGRRLYRKIRKG